MLICPSLYYNAPVSPNSKIIINCGPTHKFLRNIESLPISSDVILLSLDLYFDINKLTDDEKFLLDQFNVSFNKVLQNFVNHFYNYNENRSYQINKMPNNVNLSFNQPLLTGNLKDNLFKIIRLIKLVKAINPSIDVLILGENDENVSKSLLIAYLMDTYNYNLTASINYLSQLMDVGFNINYYNDLLILESLKKFYQENNEIKGTILYRNKNGKRSRDEDYDNRKRIMY